MNIDTDPDFVQAVKDEQTRLQESIELCLKRAKEHAESLLTVADKLRPKYELMARLKEAGFEPNYDRWDDQVTLEVKQADLTRVYRVVGRLKKEWHHLRDGRKKQVAVTLSAVNHPFLYVKYLRKLKENDTCKVVKTRARTSTSYQLVCEVPTVRV